MTLIVARVTTLGGFPDQGTVREIHNDLWIPWVEEMELTTWEAKAAGAYQILKKSKFNTENIFEI